METNATLETSALKALLRPIVRFCLKHCLKIQDFQSILKEEFVQCAKEELEKQGLRPNISKLSVMTGVQRLEISKMQNIDGDTYEEERPKGSVIGKVLHQWQNAPAYLDKKRKAKALTFKGTESELFRLIKETNSYLNPYTVIFELERLGYLTYKDEVVSLNAGVHISSQDAKEGFELVSQDVQDLLDAGSSNILLKADILNLHLRTEFDNILADKEEEIKNWLLDEGSAFHEKVRNYLTHYDKDLNPKLSKKKGGLKVVVGAFSNTNLDTQ